MNKNHEKELTSEKVHVGLIGLFDSSQRQATSPDLNNHLLLNHQEDDSLEANGLFVESFKWPGIAAIMESYERYCYGK